MSWHQDIYNVDDGDQSSTNPANLHDLSPPFAKLRVVR